MRKDTVWDNYDGTYIKTTNPLGYNVLINGTNKYLNFNTISGSSGYGFRDNSGTMQFKNFGGSWADIGTGGGGSATLTQNYVGFGDASNLLTGDASFQYLIDTYSLQFGKVENDGVISASNNGAFAHGFAIGDGFGIFAYGGGTSASGYADGGIISATSNGAFANGYTSANGSLIADGDGSVAFGIVIDSGVVNSAGAGSMAFGSANNLGTVQASGEASFAHGYADKDGSNIISSGTASNALGYATSEFSISAIGNGSLAGGYTDTGSISVTGKGTFGWGDKVFVDGDYATAFGTSITNTTANSFLVGYGGIGLFVDSSNNVGVGTVTPASTFHINTAGGNTIETISSTGSTNAFTRYVRTGSNGWAIGRNNTGAAFQISYSSTGDTPSFGTNDFFVLSNSGNLGIGAAPVNGRVDIKNTADNTATLAFTNVGANNVTHLFTQNATGISGLAAENFVFGSSSGASDMAFSPSSGATASLVLKASGNVGIGTTTPSTLLQLSSNFASNDGFAMTDTDGGYFRIVQSTGTAGAFQPIIQGYATGNTSSMIFKGLQTTTGSPTAAVTRFISRASDDSSVVNAATNAFTFENGATTVMAINGLSVGIGDTSPSTKASRLSIVGGTGTTGIPFQYLSGTLSTTGSETGAQYLITSPATAGTYSHAGLRVEFLAGYTGTGATRAFYSDNQVAGTGSDLRWNTSYSSPAGNSGGNMWASATTTGTNVGNFAEAKGGNVNVGLFGKAAAVKNSATNIGVIGHGRNTGTSPIQVGGWFSLANTAPTFVSAALVADNGDQTSPIFLARDNSTTVFSIIDGGNVITTAPVRLKGYTVATLPAGTVGDTAYATDLLAPTFGAVAVGGGAVVQPVFYNGTNWITY